MTSMKEWQMQENEIKDRQVDGGEQKEGKEKRKWYLLIVILLLLVIIGLLLYIVLHKETPKEEEGPAFDTSQTEYVNPETPVDRSKTVTLPGWFEYNIASDT